MSLPAPNPTTRFAGVRTVGALSAVLALPLASAAPAQAAVPYPKPSRTLPQGLDVAPPYQQGTRCLTEAQPGVVAFAKLLNKTYGSHVYGILRHCAAEHGEGRALDWMLDARDKEQLAVGNALTRWLAAPDAQGRPGAMARRFGINYIIWNRQQWKAWAPERGWTAYYGVSPHTDHIHVSFTWDGAYARNSWWTGTPVVDYLTGPLSSATPPPSTNPRDFADVVLRRGSRGNAVSVLQRTIGGVAVDGSFGPATEARVTAYQGSVGLPRTGVVDRAVWNALIAGKTGSAATPAAAKPTSLAGYARTTLRRGSRGESVRAMQKAIGKLAVDGAFGPATEARVKAYQKAKGLPQNGVVDTRVWNALMGRSATAPEPAVKPAVKPAADPLAKYAALTLRLWSRGEAVSAMQKAVGGLTVDGSFGPRTLARVKAWQQSTGLPVDGVVDAKDWKVLRGGSAAAPAPAAKPPAAKPPAATPPAAAARATTELTAHKGTTLRTGSSGAAVKALQAALGGLAVDGRFGPATAARVTTVQRAAGLGATGVVDRRTWDAVELRVHPLLPHWNVVLRRGSRGPVVVAVQKALRVTADGSYGPKTEAAVKAAQKSARLAQTGVVATLTWKAIEARLR